MEDLQLKAMIFGLVVCMFERVIRMTLPNRPNQSQ